MGATWQQSREVANPLPTVPLTPSTNLRQMLEASSLTEEAQCLAFQMVSMAMVRNIIQVSCPWEKIAIISARILTPPQRGSITLSRLLKPNRQTIWVTPRRASWTTSRPIAPNKLVNKFSRIISYCQRLVLTIREWWRLSTTPSNLLPDPVEQPDQPQLRQEAAVSPISSQDRVEIATGVVSTTCESNW